MTGEQRVNQIGVRRHDPHGKTHLATRRESDATLEFCRLTFLFDQLQINDVALSDIAITYQLTVKSLNQHVRSL